MFLLFWVIGKNIFYVCKEQFFSQITNENISISFKKGNMQQYFRNLYV